MTWVVPLALGGLAILLMAAFTMVSARRRHRAILAPAATVGPRILVHDINDDRCTGCDACVAVCPTNVLDLVGNKSRVLRFQDCIQCEACMFACPTEALVMFPEGGTPPALKVPEIDENFQTQVPGQYLIGEAAGKPLVKSAANLGRAVVEHMLATGMRPGALGRGDDVVDVAIVGSGPGGLSAALTCIQNGLSYVVLEKEQLIAPTVARYPKGKLVMAEPYDTANLSLLPVFDSAKEQLLPIWRELIERVGLRIHRGESVEAVEAVARASDGVFEVRSTVATYRARRVVLSIGTRGRPRTLDVPGENLPKVLSLLEDPDAWRCRSVLVVGGGDSACEAALALADAGATVMISYRGKGFSRAAPRNKQAIESYIAQGRIEAKLGSQVIAFEPDAVTLALGDGAQKRYPNDAGFVLIGADPPVQWLEKLGIRFVERPHQHRLGKTDDIVRRFVPHAIECPDDAARAAAQVLSGGAGRVSPRVTPAPPEIREAVSGPRKWLRSATSLFSNRGATSSGPPPVPPAAQPDGPEWQDGQDGQNGHAARGPRGPRRAKKLDAPVPLSEFARRARASAHGHSGHGRRDALSAGERTRILRMLRDEGGRLADEESQVDIGTMPGGVGFSCDESPARPVLRPDIPTKPAVVVGLAQPRAAREKRTSEKRTSKKVAAPRVTMPQAAPPPPPQLRSMPPPPPQLRSMPPPPPQLRSPPRPPALRSRQLQAAMHVAPGAMSNGASSTPRVTPDAASAAPRRPLPPSFGDEPTRQVDDELLAALRHAPTARPSPRPGAIRPADPDEPTRLASIDPRAFRADPEPAPGRDGGFDPGIDDLTRPSNDLAFQFLAPATEPSLEPLGEYREPEDTTGLATLDAIAAAERARHQGPPRDERTRAADLRTDPSSSDLDRGLD